MLFRLEYLNLVINLFHRTDRIYVLVHFLAVAFQLDFFETSVSSLAENFDARFETGKVLLGLMICWSTVHLLRNCAGRQNIVWI